MRFCPTCGKTVALTNKVGDSVVNEEARLIEYSYLCDSDKHKWLEVIDPYGGPTTYREVV